MSKLAILYCEGDAWPTDANRRLFELFLAFNTKFDAELDVDFATSDVERFLPVEVRSTFVDEGNVSFVLERYAAFIEWARTVQDDPSMRHRMDLDSLIQEVLGMTYAEYAAATLSFMSHFSGPRVEVARISEFEPILDVERFVAGVEDQTILRAWLDRNSTTVEEATSILRDSHRSLSAASMYRLTKMPLLRLSDNETICIALPFLHNVMGAGLFFRLNDYLRDNKGLSASAQLRGFFAAFLERHVRKGLEIAVRKTNSRVFGEVVYGKPETRSTDIVLVEHETAVFVEVNTKRFNVEESVLSLDRKQIERDLHKMVSEKAIEVHDRIADFKAGKFSLDGIEKDAIKRFIILVVTNQGVPRLIGFNHIVNEAVKGRLPLVDAFDFVDLEEIEVLPKAYDGDLQFADLLMRKAKDSDYSWQSLTNFLCAREYDRLLADPAKLSPDGPFYSAAMEAARKWGFKNHAG